MTPELSTLETSLWGAACIIRGSIDAPKAEEISKRVARVRPSIKGNLQAWEYLRSLKSFRGLPSSIILL